jgi:hypothetical protein
MRTNYLAIVVCAVLYWLLGALWYGVLFSKQWMALEGITVVQSNSMSATVPYIVTFVLNLVIAFALAQICVWRNANTAARGVAIGLLLWIGIVGPTTLTTYMYETRPMMLFAINEFYPLVGLCLMGGVLGVWKRKAA